MKDMNFKLYLDKAFKYKKKQNKDSMYSFVSPNKDIRIQCKFYHKMI